MPGCQKWGTLFDAAGMRLEISALEEASSQEDFWKDMEAAQKSLQKLKQLQKKLGEFEGLQKDYEDIMAFISLCIEAGEDEEYPECRKMANSFIKGFTELRTATLLNEEYDQNNAILTLHAGAGGTEACDWVSMLLRMYTRWGEKMGYDVEVLDYLPGEEAGVKSATIQLSGENAFGYLKSEKGVHRLVRISPFDSSGRRHTSFASCDIVPEIDDDVEIDINPEELKVDTYRSSGAGGQHVNTTDSAIRITHIPTGIVVQCQNERSQHKNRDRAMKMLRAKLYEIKQSEKLEKLADVRGEVKEIGWASQIRSYVFHPYSLVKDHRTGAEVGAVASVMDGNLSPFINAYLQWLREAKK